MLIRYSRDACVDEVRCVHVDLVRRRHRDRKVREVYVDHSRQVVVLFIHLINPAIRIDKYGYVYESVSRWHPFKRERNIRTKVAPYRSDICYGCGYTVLKEGYIEESATAPQCPVHGAAGIYIYSIRKIDVTDRGNIGKRIRLDICDSRGIRRCRKCGNHLCSDISWEE